MKVKEKEKESSPEEKMPSRGKMASDSV